MNINNVIIAGHLTRKPEVKKSFDTSYANMTIAINDYKKNKAGKFEEETTFIDVVAFGYNAEKLDNVDKGYNVMIIGRLSQDRWEDKDGNKRSRIKILAKQVRLIPKEKTNEKENFNEAASYFEG